MSIVYKNIIEYLNKKQKELFSGAIKLGFENGRLVALSETNAIDSPTNEIDNDAAIQLVHNACTKNYNGTVAIIYNSGTPCRGGYIQTWKGEVLKEYFGA